MSENKKSKELKNLRESTKEDVLKELYLFKEDLKNMRFAKAKGEDKNPLKRRILRRKIARILTVQKEKGWD